MASTYREPEYRELGERLTAIRCLAHMGLREAARLSCIGPERLRAFEDGEAEPTGSDLLMLSDAYGVSADFMLDVPSETDPFQRERLTEDRRAARLR